MTRYEDLPLDQVKQDSGLQMRVATDTATVDRYAEWLLEHPNVDLPDIIVFGDVHWLADGWHRMLAYRQANRQTIPAEIRPGERREAFMYALQANDEHGLPRSKEDKRHVVTKALEDEKLALLPNRQIARICKVDEKTVRNVKADLSADNPQMRSEDTGERIVNRGDQTYPMQTGNIGKPKSSPVEPEPEPTTEPTTTQAEDSYATNLGDWLATRQARAEEMTTNGRQEARQPIPTIQERTKPRQAEYITLDQWNEMGEDERLEALQDAGGKIFNDQQDKTGIEWALWSWNPVTGCLHNCPYCYARDIAERFYEQGFAPSLVPSRLKAPQHTTFPEAKAREWMGHKNVFTCSMADLFGRWVPTEWIEAVLLEVAAAPQWNFLFLTKFPMRLKEFQFPDNAWVGTTVDCQARVAAAERAFREVRSAVKWLSCEPLIEPLHFTDLGMFDWLVLGGSSRSSQTPEWHPPRQWVEQIEAVAERCGVEVYEKDNLLERKRGYPGVPWQTAEQAPDALRYLPS